MEQSVVYRIPTCTFVHGVLYLCTNVLEALKHCQQQPTNVKCLREIDTTLDSWFRSNLKINKLKRSLKQQIYRDKEIPGRSKIGLTHWTTNRL